jgi:hypothetical protein
MAVSYIRHRKHMVLRGQHSAPLPHTGYLSRQSAGVVWAIVLCHDAFEDVAEGVMVTGAIAAGSYNHKAGHVDLCHLSQDLVAAGPIHRQQGHPQMLSGHGMYVMPCFV